MALSDSTDERCSCAGGHEPLDAKVARFARTDAGKLAIGAFGVYLLWRLVLPSEENKLPPQAPDTSES